MRRLANDLQIYVVHRKDVALSTYAARFVNALRSEMEVLARQRGRRKMRSREVSGTSWLLTSPDGIKQAWQIPYSRRPNQVAA